MFNRLAVLKSTVLLSLTLGSMVSGMTMAAEQPVDNDGASIAIENQKIKFTKVAPNELVISMDTLKGYKNLHTNLRRRHISLSDRRLSNNTNSDPSAISDSQTAAVQTTTSDQ